MSGRGSHFTKGMAHCDSTCDSRRPCRRRKQPCCNNQPRCKANILDCTVEVLLPNFKGRYEALQTAITTQPDSINHTVETWPRLYASIHPQTDYQQSLELLKRVYHAGVVSKSGLIVGVGEIDDGVMDVVTSLPLSTAR
ncbi:MAG: hypothetical protein MI749_14700 [Desulfovibrionales bacterium]|nr:hypothetical protein [Desulfovibrionales bacterium]